ncbi:pilus assembly protein PilM [Achromatium sp. WMS3]|nr:pilus assembly protein PilM [Achromatium sp. WMS3]
MFIPFLLQKKTPMVGIDISTTAIKLIELSSSKSRNGPPQYRVESYGVEPLPPNAVVEKNIAEVEAVGETIAKVIEISKTKAKWAAVAVSGTAAITKIITMPKDMTDAEREVQIQGEADKYIPYPLDEVNIDFQVIGKSEKEPDAVDVILAASRKENIEDRVAALEIAGLKAAVVDVEAYAMQSACVNLLSPFLGEADQTIAVIDIGATTMTLNVMHNNKSIYTREQNFGGRQLTEEIQRRYGISKEEAGSAKRQGGLGLPDDYEKEILHPFKENIVKQITIAIEYFKEKINRHIDHIILAGGTAAIPGVETLVEHNIGGHSGTAVSIANPFAQMTVSPKVKSQKLSDDAPAMMIAVGLALRAFD